MNNIRIVNTDVGKMMVNCNDQFVGGSLIHYGEYSAGEHHLFREAINKNMVVIEVGANIGASTLQIAKLAKEVIAFEPHPYNFHMLCGNIALNEVTNVECIRAAVGAAPGVVSFQDFDPDQPNSNFGAHEVQPAREDKKNLTRVVQLTTDCQFLKIDVEGYELDVLKGATEMIKRCQPFIFCENDRKDRADELIRYINEVLEYKCYWYVSNLYRPENFNNYGTDKTGGTSAFNMICLPRGLTFNQLPEALPGSLDKIMIG